jgi:hypothetical protein
VNHGGGRTRESNSRRSAELIVALLCVALALIAIGLRIFGTFTGGGADMAHHYALVDWFSHHWALPNAQNSYLSAMREYPPVAHILAALTGRAIDSPFRGMQLVANVAVVSIWAAVAAILAMLPGRRRWTALGGLAVLLLLNSSAGPLHLQPHGFEVVLNFFFAQVVGQALVWWLVWFVVRRQLAGRSAISTALPTAVIAVLATSLHVVPAVELLVLVGCLCAAELINRWRNGQRTLRSAWAPIALPVTAAVTVVLTPGFRAMRKLSENDGALDVPYLAGLAGYVAVAVGVIVISLAALRVTAMRREEPPTAAVLQGLAFAGLAFAVPCILQALLLAGDEGSPYAVKKYIFGLVTVLIVDACVALAVLLPDRASVGRPLKAEWHVAAAATLTAVATIAVFSYSGSGYSAAEIAGLEQRLAVTTTRDNTEEGGDDYAVALPQSDPVLDYMFSITALAAPQLRAIDELLLPLLHGDFLRLGRASGNLVTATRSPYDRVACRKVGPAGGLVVVDAACWARESRTCAAVTVLGKDGLSQDPRLAGFSGAEPAGRWTDGERASFSCVLPRRSAKPVRIAIAATAFLPAGVPRQRVTLAAGGEKKQFVLTTRTPHRVLQLEVPAPASRRLTLTLTLPDAVSPRDAGMSADARELALFVNEIRIG